MKPEMGGAAASFGPTSHFERDAKAEYTRCKDNRGYFCRTYLPVQDRDTGKLVRFEPREAQRIIWDCGDNYPVSYILKGRRAGGTSCLLADQFWQVHMNAGMAAVTVAHDDPAAVEIFKQVRNWYNGLPGPLKAGPFKLKKQTDTEIYYEHGGSYRVSSADSRSLVGGQTIWLRHYTEFAKYKDPERIIRLTESGAAAAGRAVYDTTAEGMGYAYELWRQKNGWKKQFLKWTLDRNYRLGAEVARQKGYTDGQLLFDSVREYQEMHGLTDDQARWVGFRLVLAGITAVDEKRFWRGFHQEYPITAELAFQTAKGRVFERHYGDVQWRPGLMRFHDPVSYRAYVMGVDTATGSEVGDYSAFCILDVTEAGRPQIVATFYDRVTVPEFAEIVHKEARAYGALAVVERNNNGLDVLNRLQEFGYPMLYREIQRHHAGQQMTERLGYHTGSQGGNSGTRGILVNLLIEFIDGGKLVVRCPRMQYEANDFQWNEDNRAEATKPNHDDMLFALALALAGRDQIGPIVEEKVMQAPTSPQEAVWRMQALRKMEPAEAERQRVRDTFGGVQDIGSEALRPSGLSGGARAPGMGPWDRL